jgi:methionyl-tRNA formyltransferase
VVVAYGQILPGWILRAGRCGAVNVHASLLPRYRGAAPIARAILNGETVTGVTTMLMEETLDSGPILLQHEIPIPLSKTAGELADNLSAVGAKLLLQTLDGLRRNTLTPKIQNENMVSWAPRINKEMAPVSWKRSAGDIHNQIRAMNPWPGAYTSFRGEKLYLWRSMPESPAVRSGKAPGAFLDPSKEGIRVQCGAGTVLELLQVQRAAKKRVSGREFASGARLKAGELIFH